jgi:hypothetical protein
MQVQDAPFGKVYEWCPESVVVEYECGERLTLTSLETTCEWCGADYRPTVQEELDAQQLEDEARHPWRYMGHHEEAEISF